MVTFTVKVTDRHLTGDKVSIQQAHILSYVHGEMDSIELRDYNDNLLKVYKDRELAQLIGSAITRGRRRAENGDFYYLGDR